MENSRSSNQAESGEPDKNGKKISEEVEQQEVSSLNEKENRQSNQEQMLTLKENHEHLAQVTAIPADGDQINLKQTNHQLAQQIHSKEQSNDQNKLKQVIHVLEENEEREEAEAESKDSYDHHHSKSSPYKKQQQQQQPQHKQQNPQLTHSKPQNQSHSFHHQSTHPIQNNSYSYHNNNPNHIITNEQNDIEWECVDCNKKYKSYPAFYTHNKIKHNGNPPDRYKIPRPLDSISKDRGRPKADTSNRQKFTDKDQKQHNLEDQIYEFLAKTGSNDDQENKIIRQYLNEPVDYIESMPILAPENQLVQEIITSIKGEINKLVDLVKQHEDYQYMDPMELSDPVEQEVNLFNLKYLFLHYKTYNLLTDYSVIAIFIAWIGKELRFDAYQELVSVALAYFTVCQEESTKQNHPSEELLKEIFEKIYSNHKYLDLLETIQLKLFPREQVLSELVQLIKSWMVYWIDSANIDLETYSEKKDSPIGQINQMISVSDLNEGDQDEDDADLNQDANRKEVEEEEHK